jgi:formyl-CoA transferase
MEAQAGALAGVKVVDLTRILGGPFGTQILGDHGAEVIKVEPPEGDETRTWGARSPRGVSVYFEGINRNKKFVAIDFSRAEGRDVLFRLLDTADVLIHNFKSGTLERWGLGYDDVLAKRFPRLVYCHITGFGEDGPLGGLPGYDAIVQAMAGNMSVNGTEASGRTRVGMPIVDIGASYNAVIAILMALLERTRSGRGQKLDIALYDCALAFLHPYAAGTMYSGRAPGLIGNSHPSVAPYDKFRTGSGEIFIGCGNNRQFAKLCEILGSPNLAEDPRYRSNNDRLANRDALRRDLEARLQAHDAKALSDKLLRAGVPGGAVLDLPDIVNAPHTVHRKMKVELGEYRGLGVPIKLSRTPGGVRHAPPHFGADTRAVCRDAGLDDEKIQALVADKVIFEGEG